jgi:hypothetical protein
VQLVQGGRPPTRQFVPPVGEQPQSHQLVVRGGELAQAGVRNATAAIECASVASVMRPCPVSNARTRAASFAGTSRTRAPSANNR